MTPTTNPAIPADINNLQSIAGALSDMLDMAYQGHSNCDLDSETECSGEQYGDGNADEHCRLRDAEATVKLLLLKHELTLMPVKLRTWAKMSRCIEAMLDRKTGDTA